jgi:AraC-like DNA-binding protein
VRHLARNTLLVGILDLAESFGVDHDDIMSEVGLDPAMAQGVGVWIPSEAIIDATELSAERSGRSDFGLLLGARQDHRLMGPLGLLFEQAETIEELQALSRRFFHLHNTALRYTLSRRRNRGIIRLQIRARGAFMPRHYVEALFVICVRMAQIILGPRWRPLNVLFEHGRMANRASYERYLGTGVRFGQSMNAITCHAADLDRKATHRDPELKGRLESMLHDLDTQYINDVRAKVGHLVRTLLPSGQASIANVAKLTSATPRTLQRRLREQGSTFSEILVATRLEIARTYLRGGSLSVTELAPILGFSEASAVSRFLRDHAGLTTRQLRASARKHAR